MPNEFVSVTQLLNPTLLATGTVTAKVYGDSLSCPSTVDHVAGTVTLNGNTPLAPLESLEQFKGNNLRGRTGRPTHYWVQPAAQSLGMRIRVTPRPDRPFLLNYEAAKKATRFTIADLIDDTKLVTVLGDQAETIWLPIAKFHLRDHPHFDDSLIRSVESNYMKALGLLRNKSNHSVATGDRRAPYSMPPSKRY